MNISLEEKPDLRFIKRLKYSWREYLFHLFKEFNSGKYYLIFSYGELSLPFVVDVQIISDFERSNQAMKIQNHVFTEDCIKELFKEINDFDNTIFVGSRRVEVMAAQGDALATQLVYTE